MTSTPPSPDQKPPSTEQPYSASVFSTGRARGFWILAACCVLLGLWWLLSHQGETPAAPSSLTPLLQNP